MSTYSRAITVNFGPSHSGLSGSLTYLVTSPDGVTTHIAATGAGIREISGGTGSYAAQITADTAWGQVIVFWQGPGNLSEPQSADFSGISTNTGGPRSQGGYVVQASFDPALTTQKDEVRARVGDVSPIPQWFLDDRTIIVYLSKYSFAETCARCAEDIGAICIQIASRTEQKNLKIQYEDRSKKMFELADRIRNDADPEPGTPKRYGAISSQMSGPDLSNYLSSLGLPIGDPNGFF